ncbi:lipopolysaccharide-induced tumor necrosis factor-alpha factor homolog isoform X1 [Neoarius graeffei]|uniref:lipopolysaccharide-induced tumor necrosis factor-alpha factor homolog isoform X1 n=1 Tax=Neoarius graeffei TaxID=443677 RepID=UPI00298C726D|nr:lipopolysaccharide-induced tumor necrosis factor-alpha factor homolog isoform X1 [Neoarius graeffei]XP_060755125.1 lipopolysaccharide-induced tumor necrosis factor-alpha factor homolog isoform X1 [Neoarius graeffei]
MEPNPPPSYPMHECPYPPVPVTDKKDAAYPPPPTYSATMAQPAPMVMQSQPAAVQPRIAIQTQPAVMVVMQSTLADVPAPAKCNFCQQQIVTVTKPKNGLLVWAIFGVLLVIGCWPCCLIPFCVNSCKDVMHTCPNCGNVLHIYKRV